MRGVLISLLFLGALFPGGVLVAHAASFPLLDSNFSLVPDAHDLDLSCSPGAPLSFGAVMEIVQRFVNAGITLGIFFFVVIMAWAGFIFIMSATNPESRSKAKQMLLNASIGLLIVLSAWLMVDFVMKTLYSGPSGTEGKFGPWNSILGDGPACVTATNTQPLFSGAITASELSTSGGLTTSPADLGSPGASASGDEAAVRRQLTDAGVTIWHNACAPGTSGGCTNVGGVRPAGISQVIIVRNKVCGSNKSCRITLTGGSEPGHASGQYSHGNGYKVDIDDTAAVNTVLNTLRHTSNRGGDKGGPIFTDSCGNEYVHESTHWDITVKTVCAL